MLVIGGGPAGSTIATLLARQGRQVVVLEKAQHPRFHIGESLLPAGVPLLRELGVADEVAAIGLPKWGVEFNSPQHSHRMALEFSGAWDKGLPQAWQVRRADFDDILFRNAARAGATTLEGASVQAVRFDDAGADVRAQLADGSQRHWRAEFVVDASGRDTLLATQNGWKRRSRRHNSAALYGHFRGARRLPGREAGHISIFWFQHGWFWFIPLADGSTSVGAVCWPHYLKSRQGSLRQFFMDTIAQAPRLAERLQGAELIGDQVWATGNYSYSADRCQGERFLLLGDAYAFVDPVFSSGVHLAMVSAFEGARVVQAHFEQPTALAAERRRFDRVLRHGPRQFSWFIHRMTNPTLRDLFMHPQNPLRMQEAVLSLLAGDIYGKAPIWCSLGLFKAVYYTASLLALPRTLRAAWQRRRNIRDVGALRGENVMVSGVQPQVGSR
ncbi:MAG: NAD(P)/FAD-dependent oxidoreductase [Rubrivivax sp.]